MAKQGKTLQELAIEIERQANAKKDFVAPAAQIGLAVVDSDTVGFKDTGKPVPTVKLVLGDGNYPKTYLGEGGNPVNIVPLHSAPSFALNNLAHGQMAEYLGIPKPYYDKCLREQPDLLARNVNQWLAKLSADATSAGKKESRMIRTLDGNVRAVLSDRYRPLENYDLATAVLPVLQEQELVIVSCEITERRLYIKAFDKRIEREIAIKGTDPAHTFLKDVVFPSITISNSEVGSGSLSVAAGLYTGGCTNFASFSDSRMRKYHVGGKALDSADVYALLTDDTKKLTDAAVWAQTRDVVRSAFETARFEELVGRIQQTTTQKIEGDVVQVVEVVGAQFGMNKGERGSVLKHLIEGGDLSRYGVFNAVTRTAEDLPDYERATEFERIGGQIIELDGSQWKKMAAAA
jgi:hypothetical protein